MLQMQILQSVLLYSQIRKWLNQKLSPCYAWGQHVELSLSHTHKLSRSIGKTQTQTLECNPMYCLRAGRGGKIKLSWAERERGLQVRDGCQTICVIQYETGPYSHSVSTRPVAQWLTKEYNACVSTSSIDMIVLLKKCWNHHSVSIRLLL